jgi:hypothetical protein
MAAREHFQVALPNASKERSRFILLHFSGQAGAKIFERRTPGQKPEIAASTAACERPSNFLHSGL